MYIYEHHMGYLYTSDRALTWEELHCEVCGDSDWLIGYATTRARAWDLLKDETATFDEAMCVGCPHEKDYEYCNNCCEQYMYHSGGWDYSYVMKFINDNWEE